MMNFSFYAPSKIIFGPNARNQIIHEIKALARNRILIVTDPGIEKTIFLHEIVDFIKATGVEVDVFSKVIPNPTDSDCVTGHGFAKEMGTNLIVAVGGGSSIDTAKTIATLLANGGKPSDYYGNQKIDEEIAPLIAIPTTSGTGSEVTPFAVITDTHTRIKMNILDSKVVPKIALVDPELTFTLPPLLTASTGLDALTHAIEAYTCNIANPLTDTLALKSISLIAENIRAAVKNGANIEARTNMSLGSLVAGLAFGNSDVGGVHCMAEAIGGYYNTPHGVANSIFLPLIMEFNIPSNTQKYADVAFAMGVDIAGLRIEEAALKGVIGVQDLCRELDIPKFKELEGVNKNDFPALAKYAADNVSAPSNPRKAGEKEYLELFEKAFSL